MANTSAPFAKRLIEVTITLAPNTGANQVVSFTPSGSNTVTLSGSRTSVRISNSGAPGGSHCSISIWGLTLNLINQLSTLGMIQKLVPNNAVLVKAGDTQSGLSAVFGGTIWAAYGDFQGAPDVPFRIDAQSGYAAGIIPVPASSYPGATDVATVLKSLANLAGWGFVNNGVNGPITTKVSDPYLPGAVLSQVQAICNAAQITYDLGPTGTVLSIWPKGSYQAGTPVPISPPPTGQMIGYPSYTAQGIIVKTLFNPQLAFGGQFAVSGSSLKRVNGNWYIGRMDMALDSLVPGGKWDSTLYGYDPNNPLPVIQQSG